MSKCNHRELFPIDCERCYGNGCTKKKKKRTCGIDCDTNLAGVCECTAKEAGDRALQRWLGL